MGSRTVVLVACLAAASGCPGDGADEGGDDGADTGTASTGGDPSEDSGDTGTADETGTAGESGPADETGEDLGPWGSLDERPCPDDSFLTHENFGGPFMLTYCTSCHASRLPADMRQGSPIDVNFDDLADIRAWADRIWIRAADTNSTMPPVGAADDETRARLGEWLACGAPSDADLGQ